MTVPGSPEIFKVSLYGTTSFGGSFSGGTVFSLQLLPQLTLIISEPNVILTWPTNYAGYALQSTTDVGLSTVLMPVSPAPRRPQRPERRDQSHLRHTAVFPVEPVIGS
jgi:hypothetical protein